MALYKRGKVWWMAYTVRGPEGEPARLVRKSTKQINKKRAEDIWADVVKSLTTGTYVPDEARPFPRPWEVVLESYLEDRERRGKRSDSYRKLEDWRAAFKGRDLASLTLEDVETQLATWTAEREWKPATYNNALAQVSGVFSFAYRRGWIPQHPLRGRAERIQLNNERTRYLRTHELTAIKRAALVVARGKTPRADRRWLYNLVTVAAATGLRRGVLCNLRCQDAERDERGTLWLYVGRDKNGEPVHKPVGGELAEIVERRRARALPAAYLFPGPGEGNAYTALGRFLPLAVGRVEGLTWGATRDGVTFHTFRHSMASLAANSGVPLDVVQAMGNWRTSSMMRRYAHLADERLAAGEARLAEVLEITSHSRTSPPNAAARQAARTGEVQPDDTARSLTGLR